jgi:uncharacterized membrane protein
MNVESESITPPESESVLPRIDQASAAGRYKRTACVFLGLLVVYALVRGVTTAAAKVFWLDEFFTLTIAGQQNVHGMWNELRQGFDTQPPLFYLIERLTLNVPVTREIALRLPSILAFACIVICVFAFAKRQVGESVASVCALLVLTTSLFHTYLVDARPYTMLVACITFAMVCYQRTPARPWTAFLALSLLAAEALHYYAVFVMVPFGIAELALTIRTWRLRPLVWGAMACGAVPLLISLRYLLQSKTFYGRRYFARPELAHIKDYYGKYFYVTREMGVALLMLSVAAILWFMVFGIHRLPDEDTDGAPRGDIEFAQGVLLLGMAMLPAVLYAATLITNSAMNDRYTLSAAIALILGVGYVLAMVPRRVIALFAVFLLVLLGVRELNFWRNGHFDALAQVEACASSSKELTQIENFIQSAGHSDLPIVFDQELLYPQAAFYCAPAMTKRVVFLADEDREFQFDGNDTAVRIFRAFRHFFPLRVEEYSQYTRTQPQFLLYAEPEGWMLNAMLHEGSTAQLLEIRGPQRLYLVQMKESGSR